MLKKATITTVIAFLAVVSATADAGPQEAAQSGAEAVGRVGEKAVNATKRGLKAAEAGIEHGVEKADEVVSKAKRKAGVPTGENKAPKGADAVSPKPTP